MSINRHCTKAQTGITTMEPLFEFGHLEFCCGVLDLDSEFLSKLILLHTCGKCGSVSRSRELENRRTLTFGRGDVYSLLPVFDEKSDLEIITDILLLVTKLHPVENFTTLTLMSQSSLDFVDWVLAEVADASRCIDLASA